MGAAILPNLLRLSMLRKPDVTSVVSQTVFVKDGSLEYSDYGPFLATPEKRKKSAIYQILTNITFL